jgi:hypothetical protein
MAFFDMEGRMHRLHYILILIIIRLSQIDQTGMTNKKLSFKLKSQSIIKRLLL